MCHEGEYGFQIFRQDPMTSRLSSDQLQLAARQSVCPCLRVAEPQRFVVFRPGQQDREMVGGGRGPLRAGCKERLAQGGDERAVGGDQTELLHQTGRAGGELSCAMERAGAAV